jgi:hypothetical protein
MTPEQLQARRRATRRVLTRWKRDRLLARITRAKEELMRRAARRAVVDLYQRGALANMPISQGLQAAVAAAASRCPRNPK